MPRGGSCRCRRAATAISRKLAIVLWLLAALPALAAEEKAGPAAPPPGPVFIKLPPINIPVIEGNKVVAQVDISLMVELAEGRTAESVEAQHTRLLDAFISDCYGLFQQRTQPGRTIDGQAVKERLRGTARRILGRDAVKDVLIEQFFEQPR
jgi:hypothetical protein